MTPELFIISKASEAIQALYNVEMPAGQLQVQVTRKEFEGDFTLVVFPLLRISKTTPENTGNAIGEWLKENVEEIAGYNTVKGFLNLSFSNAYWNRLFSEIASAEDFGQLAPTGRTIMVEYSSPNTNKPLHLGHIRNNLLGWPVCDLPSPARPPDARAANRRVSARERHGVHRRLRGLRTRRIAPVHPDREHAPPGL